MRLSLPHPVPTAEDLARHYPPEYHAFTVSQPSFIQKSGILQRARLIQHLQPTGGALLDLGCGPGFFLQAFQSSPSWKLTGIEPENTAATFAREQFHLNVLTGDLFSATLASESMDVITLWDVLEHLPDPAAHLAEISRVLTPLGWLVIKTPHPNGWDASIFKQYWVGYEAPVHLSLFTPQVLHQFLTATGFTRYRVITLGTDYRPFFKSLEISLRNSNRENLARRVSPLSNFLPIRMIISPILSLLRAAGKVSSLVYVYQKSDLSS